MAFSDTNISFSKLPSTFQYSQPLNCIIATSEEIGFEIIDIHSGKKSCIPFNTDDKARSASPQLCAYFEKEEKIVVTSNHIIGCRATNNEQVYLHTILQLSQIPSSGVVTIELGIAKAGLLLVALEKCIKTTDRFSSAPGMSSEAHKKQFEEVINTLRDEYEKSVLLMKDASGLSLKWLTVCFTIQHSLITEVCDTALLLLKQEKRGPALPVLGDVLQRLTSMQKHNCKNVCSEKLLMFNEIDRLKTFTSWPHMNYKWALPGPMAEAGFYHPQIDSKATEDRAMCFTCNVSLVYWESSDQPWSEHKRHCSDCPFLKGDYTENVSLQDYAATSSAKQLSRTTDKIVCVSGCCYDNLIAVGTEEGYIVVWEMHPSFKIHSEYQISVTSTKGSHKSFPKIVNNESSFFDIETQNKLSGGLQTEILKKNQSESFNNKLGSEAAIVLEDIKSLSGAMPVLDQTNENFVGDSYNILHSCEKLEILKEFKDSQVSGFSLTPNNQYSDKQDNTNQVSNKQDNANQVSNKKEDSQQDNDNRNNVKQDIDNQDICIKDNANQVSNKKENSQQDNDNQNNIKQDIDNQDISKQDSKQDNDEQKNNKCNNTLGDLFKKSSNHLDFVEPLSYYDSSKRNTSKMKSKSHGTKRSFKITSVAIMKDARTSQKFIVAGVKIDSVKYSKHKLSEKHKLSLLTYKIESKVSNENGQEENSESFVKPYQPFMQVPMPLNNTVFDSDSTPSWFGLNEDFGIYENGDTTQLSIIDEYLIASKHLGITNGGTQNIAMDANEIKTGFDQEEILKTEDNKSVYKDCAFQKFDLCENINKSGVISKLLVIDDYLVVMVNEKSDEKPQSSIFIISVVFDSFKTILKKVAFHSFQESEVNDIISVSPLQLPMNIFKNIYSNFTKILSVLIVALSNNSVTFLSVPDLEKLPLQSNLPNSFAIHRLAYCSALSAIAICDENGSFSLHQWTSEQNEEVHAQNSSISNRWPNHFCTNELQLLCDLIKFEPVMQGCNIVYPMNWCVNSGKKLLSSPPVLPCMMHLSPVEMDSQLLKETDGELNKTSFTFEICVSVNTAIGYFDVVVNMKTPLKNKEDFSCSFYFDALYEGHQTIDKSQEILLCSPMLFSDVVNDSKLSGKFTVTSPNLLQYQSGKLVVKLVSCKSLLPNFSISSALKDVFVGVHKFQQISDHPFYYTGCRQILISDANFQSNLLDQYLELVSANCSMLPGKDLKMILKILSVIVNIHLNCFAKSSLPLISIVHKKLWQFLKASMMFGDRAVCYSCFCILLGLIRCSSNSTFIVDLSCELRKLSLNIHNAFSSAAIHWTFLLFCKIMESSELNNREMLLHFKNMLITTGKIYSQKVTETQKYLDAFYGLSEMVTEPLLTEPHYLQLHIGASYKTGDTTLFETIRISSNNVPGILETQPLRFVCSDASEGSKVQLLNSKYNVSKVNQTWSAVQGIPQLVNQTDLEKPSELLQENDDSSYFGISNPEISNVDQKTFLINSGIENAEDNSYLPLPKCMVVEKMHLSSWHYVVLDFQSPVLLTDFLIPPCKALSSITLSILGTNQEVNRVIAYSDEISSKALIMSNLVEPITLQYLKILVMGGISSSVTIPLGQFYGYLQKDVLSPGDSESYLQQYEDVFCRYTFTIERFKPISNPHDCSNRFSKGLSSYLNSLKKDHALGCQLQLSLNFLRNNIFNQSVESLLQNRNFADDLNNAPLQEDASFSNSQVILLHLLETILHFITPSKIKNEVEFSILSKEEFVMLFENLCVYGVAHLTSMATIVLSMLSASADWWSDALVEVFKNFFCVNSLIPVPRGRLFKRLAQLISSTKDKDIVLEKFLILLHDSMNVLLHPKTSSELQCNPSMVDWLLLVLSTLLESSDSKVYSYLSPWEYLCLPKSVSDDSNSMDNNTLSSEKLKKQMFDKLPKNYFTQSKETKETDENQSMNEEDFQKLYMKSSSQEFNNGFFLEQPFFIQRCLAVPTLKVLMEFISSKVISGNLHQLTLACKVSSLILANCHSIVYLEDVLLSEHLKMLLTPCLVSNTKHWHLLAINTLVNCFLNQKSFCDDKKVNLLNDEKVDSSMAEKKQKKKKKIFEKKKNQETRNFLKQLLEITEGKITDKKKDSCNSIAKESECLKECLVTRVVLGDIFFPLEQEVAKLQNKVTDNKLNLYSLVKWKQRFFCSDHKLFDKDLKKMQSLTLHYLLNCLLDFDICKMRYSLFIRQVLFFMEHMMNSGIKPSHELTVKLELVLSKLYSEISVSDIFTYTLFKKLVELNLQMDIIPASFICKVRIIQNTYVLDPELEIISLYKLTEQLQKQPDEKLQTENTVLAQKLFSTILSNREIDGDPKIVSLLEKICQTKPFYCMDKEGIIKIIQLITEKVKFFITRSSEQLDFSQKAIASNKVFPIFLIDESCAKMIVRTHHNEEATECLKLLKILSNFDFSILTLEQTVSMEKVCINLLDALCNCPKLRMKNGLAQNTLLTEISDSLPEPNAVHPIVFGIIVTLTDLSKTQSFSDAFINALVLILQQRVEHFEWKGDLSVLIKLLLLQNSEFFPKFVAAGGFKLICDAIVFHCKKEISWVDALQQSPVMHELYINEISQLTKKNLDHEGTMTDKLENFAPYAKIIPSGAAVLLVDKSPLRRSRFAAYGHQFQESDDTWFQLHITFPVHILLKEIKIHMHPSCLQGGPSLVMVEYKGVSDSFNPASTILETSGLLLIQIHFTEGIICKELRLHLNRPSGCDNLKLNLLELFGRSIFTIMDKGQKFNFEAWLDLLSIMLTDTSTELIKSYLSDSLIDSLVCLIPFLTRLSLHRISALLMSVFLKVLPDFAYKFVVLTTTHMLKISYLNRFNSWQMQLLIQLLSDIVIQTDAAQQVSIFSYLFEWFAEFLNVVQDDSNARVSDVIQCFVVKLFQHAKDLEKESLKASEKLISELEKFILNNSIHHSNISYVGQLLQIIIHSKQDFFFKYLQIADTFLNSFKINETQFVKALDIIIFAYQSNIPIVHENTYDLLGKISKYFVSILSQPITGLANIKSACIILKCFCKFSLANNGISAWFYSNNGRLFWKELLLYTLSPHINGSILLNMYKLQQQTLKFFHSILYLNKQNMDYFCKILIDVLLWTKDHNRTMSGYLKQIIIDLVIAEDTVTVHFRSKWNTYILQNTHKLHFRITASLNEIEVNFFKMKSSSVTDDKQSNRTDNNKLSDLLNAQVMQSGKLAIFKRQPKSTTVEVEQLKPNSDEQLGIDFFQPFISNQPLPKALTIGQILQLLHEKDSSILDSPPLLEYCVKYEKSSDKANPKENDTLLLTAPFSTMLEIFANLGGLSLLSPAADVNHNPFVKLFSLIIPLPGFSSVFLEDRIKAEFMLRLMMGVKETKAGQVIQDLAVAQNLYVLPLISLWKLLLLTPLDYEHFFELRIKMLKEGVLNFIINLLEDLVTSKNQNPKSAEPRQTVASNQMTANNDYWAKGTGFGTGSTTSNWDIKKAISEKKKKEKQLVVIFQVLAAFLCEENKILNDTYTLFENSCVMEVLSGYLRNDSVFDMSHHIVLYHAILKLVRSLASSTITLKLLTGVKGASKENSSSVVKLLAKLKSCVETYNKRLKLNNKPKKTVTKSRVIVYKDEEDLSPETDTEELNFLLDHIELTSDFVQHKADDYDRELNAANKNTTLVVDTFESNNGRSNEQLYVAAMSQLQFDTYEIVTEKEDGTLQFNVPFYYASTVRSTVSATNDSWNSSRARRLAQEVATLSTSLPLSYSSTVFLRCDNERLDVMKVLITGPEDTPYENGCFEFDIYFPAEYPSSPMSVNLKTTGKQTVRFNPNLYNDGKVCLSILNTWHGRPEERWSPQTSSLLQVLVSIQSLILVSEPYFNEPGYERMRATPQGKQNSCDYNTNIQQATIKWAMIEQIKRPSLCFREIIHRHFLMKQADVISQCERWLAESKQNTRCYESLNNTLAELKIELMKLEKNQNSSITKETVEVDESITENFTSSTVIYL
ncbi:uncharacterized protein LOC100214758 isoform X1 [Hydra vulgaris]|uniref:uncharacterized protein LOC100214758 isoform X1 n=1 Tax=Hydra vulgaris TaxID=6087 RepID=UPI001F5F8C1C|nr:uncharacterized protein LOC100214758 [Hydra vulgaris]